jgi:hypothetical protein
MFRWLDQQGQAFRNSVPGSTNYISAYNAAGQLKRAANSEEDAEDGQAKQVDENTPKEIPPARGGDLCPYPTNKTFQSQPVLSEDLRHEIWNEVMKSGKSVREVSAHLKVEMRRVGAVVRLMEVEKEWERKGKPLAISYHKAVMNMLPQTPLDREEPKIHESINDLPVHRKTGQQIFLPASESRHFTRADAAKVFDEKLLPADDRVPHPELAIMHKENKEGLSENEREARNVEREKAEQLKRARKREKLAKQEAEVMKVNTSRWEFRIEDINVDAIGKDGRGHKGVGWRYGMPHMDRSRAQVKIPTSVE